MKRARLPAGSGAAPARETLVVVAIVFGLALAVRIAAGIDAQDAPFWSTPTLDELNHLDLARRLVAGAPPPHGAFYIAPGYAYFLAVVMQAGGGGTWLSQTLLPGLPPHAAAVIAKRAITRWATRIATMIKQPRQKQRISGSISASDHAFRTVPWLRRKRRIGSFRGKPEDGSRSAYEVPV